MKSREKRLLIVSGIAAILFVVIVILSLPPLRHSVFPTKEDKLFVAIWNADTNSVANLLAAGANPNSIAWSVRRATPLIDAVRFGHLVIVQMLLERGADPNIGDRGDHAALHYALTSPGLYDDRESGKILSMLLAHGANPQGKGVVDAMRDISPNDNRWETCQEVLKKLGGKEAP
jgi:hypothetical protein